MSANHDDEFIQQIRDVLAHLYDHVYLQRHPLAERLVPVQEIATRTRGQELRRIFLDAIEALNPGDNVPIRAVERRPYAILFGLYVEGQDRREVAASLGIGGRQLRRDRTGAFEALASILWDHYLADEMDRETSPSTAEPLRSESERLAQQRELVALYDLVRELLPLLKPKALEKGIDLVLNIRPDLPKLYVNRVLLRQILISVAGYALANLPLTELSFEAQLSEGQINIGLALQFHGGATRADDELPGLTSTLQSVETLITTLEGEAWQDSGEKHRRVIWLSLPRQDETVVLVVDDNEELFALFQRYVANQPYRLIHAASVEQALEIVHASLPDLITLDLMMPNRDGWEFLHTMRSEAKSVHIPVIVCSVLEDPDLALSLGARAYLKKPVSATDLLQVLTEVKMSV